MTYEERVKFYSSNSHQRIEDDFAYHPATKHQQDRYNILRVKAKELAYEIMKCCPDSEERSMANTKLEEALFWANAAVARDKEN